MEVDRDTPQQGQDDVIMNQSNARRCLPLLPRPDDAPALVP
jgi:hypothetical protein